MLDVCLPGYRRKERTHNWCISAGDRSYPRIPRDTHNKRHNPDIQIGHVRSLVRFFDIRECAESQLPQLRC